MPRVEGAKVGPANAQTMGSYHTTYLVVTQTYRTKPN